MLTKFLLSLSEIIFHYENEILRKPTKWAQIMLHHKLCTYTVNIFIFSFKHFNLKLPYEIMHLRYKSDFDAITEDKL